MSNQLATITERIQYTPDQLALIKSQIAPQAKDEELKLFLYQCQRTGLDALSRQIYCIHRGGKMTVQTSIDGFRVIAERSGDYAGQDEPVFTEENGKLICCKVTVYRFRGEQRYPAAVGVAFLNEYSAGGPMWTKMPHTMLSKCAEAVALRKAYPQDLSGLYTNDEMNQADVPGQSVEINDVPTEAERKLLRDMVFNSTLEDWQKEETLEKIETCSNYKKYELIQMKLQDVQKGFNDVTNPNATDVKNHIKKITGKAPANVE